MEERFAARYEDLERWHWWFRGRERILESVLGRELARAELARPPAMARAEPTSRRVVAVGCGPPGSLGWVSRTCAGTVIGVDADPSGALRERRARGELGAPPGVEFLIGRAEAPPLRPRSCDAVLALDVIEHVDDDAAALKAAADLVRPGGFLLVTVPALPSLWGRQDVVSHHRRRYTARTLARSFERASLPLSWQSYFNTLLLLPIAAIRWSRRWMGRDDAVGSDFDGGRPGAANDWMARLFASERHLVGRMRLPLGVSLIGVARIGQRP